LRDAEGYVITEPNLRPAVVECGCPCTSYIPDPCDPDRMVMRGDVRGVVDHTDDVIRYSGAEFPTIIDLGAATEIFVTVEPDTSDAPEPSADLLLQGDLVRNGDVLIGELDNPTTLPVRGKVTIVPTRDGASL
jgi:hypothetical protein